MLLIPTLGRQRQADFFEFKVHVVYIVRPEALVTPGVGVTEPPDKGTWN